MSTDVLAIRGDGTATSETIPDIPGPQLPVWTFNAGTGGTPSAGMFQLDNANPLTATNIYFNVAAKNGQNYQLLFDILPPIVGLVLTDSSGLSVSWKISGSIFGNPISGTISNPSATSTALSGDYTLSFAPGAQTPQFTADTDWVANAGSGDKTASIPAIPDTSALETLSTGFTAWATAMDGKVKALETALVALKYPNA